MKKLLSFSLMMIVLGVLVIGCGGPAAAPEGQAVTTEHNPDAEHEAGAEAEHAAK
jgi:ABC-type glycerol-3-phosphate transport system substrate-binding protein